MKNEIYTKIKLRELFEKSSLINPQKQGSGPAPLSFCNSVAKWIKGLREIERFFEKNLSKLKIFKLA